MKQLSPAAFFAHNTRYYYLFEFARSLVFAIPVWVAFELQYISFSQLTFIEGTIFAIQLILELPTGAFADLFGKKWTIFMGYMVSGIALLVYSFSTTFSMFMAYAVLLGLGEALISGAREAFLYDTAKQAGKEHEYEKMSGKFGIVFQFGLGLASIVGGVLALFHFRLPFLAYAATLFSAAFISLFFIEPSIDTEKFTLKNYILQTKRGARELFKTPLTRKVSLYYVLVGAITWSAMLIFNNTFLVSLSYTAFELGIFFAFTRVFNSVFLYRLVAWKTFANRKITYIFFPLLMIAAYLPGVWLTKWVAIPFVMASMFASTARWVVLGRFMNLEFESKNRATALSTLSMGIGILYVLFAFLSGPIIELSSVGMIYTLFGVFSITLILPLGLYLAYRHA